MEKLFKVLGIVVLVLVVLIGLGTIVQAASSGGIFPVKNGWSFGSTSDYITFFKGTPVQQQALTNTPAVNGTGNITAATTTVPLVSLSVLIPGGGTQTVFVATNALSVVTSVTATGAFTVAGFASTNQANQLINAIRNLNLAQ